MGYPKALLLHDGQTFLNGLIQAFSQCDQVVVVLGYDSDRIRESITRPATVVVNPSPELGQLTSLQCALRAVPDADAICFTPVDYPAIRSTTVRALLDNVTPLTMPRYRGRRGHPVLVGRTLIDELLNCTTAAHDVIRAHEPLYVDVDDPGILHDVDDPAAYSRLQEVGV